MLTKPSSSYASLRLVKLQLTLRVVHNTDRKTEVVLRNTTEKKKKNSDHR